MTITRNGTSLNVPDSWFRMKFLARLNYLVNTHQTRDHKTAAGLLRRPKVKTPPLVTARLPYANN